jgi:quinohemoprotein ethanol dehydrogenase
MSYNPQTGLAYIPAMHLKASFVDEGVDHDNWKTTDFLEGDTVGVAWTLVEETDNVMSTLQGWDPVRGEIAWEVPLPGKWNAGTMTTAGNLVLQGRALGELVAYDASNGEVLWSYDLGLGISAPPVTYAIDGKQYVSVLVGWGGGASGMGGATEAQHGWAYGRHTRRLVTFSLDGTATLPKQPPPLVPKPIPMPDFQVDLAMAGQGETEYLRCFYCHGFGAVANGMAPDLRASAVVGSDTAFDDTVRGGSRKENGMPAFAHLSDEQLQALRHYVRLQAQVTAE